MPAQYARIYMRMYMCSSRDKSTSMKSEEQGPLNVLRAGAMYNVH